MNGNVPPLRALPPFPLLAGLMANWYQVYHYTTSTVQPVWAWCPVRFVLCGSVRCPLSAFRYIIVKLTRLTQGVIKPGSRFDEPPRNACHVSEPARAIIK
jgi:hypothetical protein